MSATAGRDTPLIGLLLAAGLSRRFGSDKRTAIVDGCPMPELGIRRWLAALPSPSRLTVVLRHDEDDALVARTEALGARALRAAGSARGMGASLVAGAAAQSSGTALLVGSPTAVPRRKGLGHGSIAAVAW